MSKKIEVTLTLSAGERRILISVLRKRKALDPAVNALLERVALALGAT